MSTTAKFDEPVFDREALDRHTMSNASLQRELFILFFDQMPVYIDQMDEAVSSGDTESWRMAAHGIKGSSRALGFPRLATLARDAEASTPCKERLRAMRDLIAETRDCVPLEEAV